MESSRILVLGTRNRKKGRELAALLSRHGLELKTLDDIPEACEIVEDGHSFEANAQAKAVRQAVHLKQWVLGEDSGLVVDALDGDPGIYSARFSGEYATDASNNALLLERLAGVPPDRRTAHYVCHASLADPSGAVRIDVEAICRGRIRKEPIGTGGFGYDPLFEIVECHHTFGQLGPAFKQAISHRGRALRRLVPQIAKLIASGAWEETFELQARSASK